MKDDKKLLKTNSSAEHVEQHLQELEKADYELLYYSQEQTFSAEDLSRLINEERLSKLMTQSDEFLSSLDGEIKGFNE